MNDEIRRVIRDHGHLSVDVDTLGDDDDLYQAGMTSHASVNVMIALGQTDLPQAAPAPARALTP